MTPSDDLPLSAAELQEFERTGICRLSNRGLTTLPPEILELTNLELLTLDHNQLTALPPEIALLTNLASLSLDGNRIAVQADRSSAATRAGVQRVRPVHPRVALERRRPSRR